ncbi:hypothetical protein [Pseudomonas sp. PDM11]|uniref:hypothetical protein n=1 Tax=Pseudomonas sp. PDM11 TaxID=2769309 RepID=UPI00177BAAE3|nr:hypothetical protein [Pseudomonas sp. PDM11]MBD9396015.1 hypothetical protein [Pseudomonas sp. PDM11]
MARYEIAFSGELVPGAQLEAVQANLAKLFQADAQRIAQLFSGRRVVIKNNLDEAAAEKYRSTLERAGARVEVVDTDAQVIEEIELAPPPPAAPASQPAAQATGRLVVAPRDEYMAAFVDVDAPDFGVAALGADLQDGWAEVAAPDLDLSAFSLAPVGSDMGQAKAAPAAPAPDTSHLKLL